MSSVPGRQQTSWCGQMMRSDLNGRWSPLVRVRPADVNDPILVPYFQALMLKNHTKGLVVYKP